MTFTCRLSSRSLIRLTGVDAQELLQGLFTNNLFDLRPGGSMWGCFLHHTGRVMCDAYLYSSNRHHTSQGPSILIDVHRDMATTTQEHLIEMRMRKKVQIDMLHNENSACGDPNGLTVVASTCPDVCGEGGDVESFDDPRREALSLPLRKFILPASAITSAGDPEGCYTEFLYRAGIGEGPAVFRPGKSLPFEANTDFLKGVSFHKGCYVGQELTHRTHVMLVTRKRTVPLRFPHRVGTEGRPVTSGEGLFVDGTKVGEVLTASGDVGLGLLRLRYVDPETRKVVGLTLHDALPVETTIPSWWPEREVKKMLSTK